MNKYPAGDDGGSQVVPGSPEGNLEHDGSSLGMEEERKEMRYRMMDGAKTECRLLTSNLHLIHWLHSLYWSTRWCQVPLSLSPPYLLLSASSQLSLSQFLLVRKLKLTGRVTCPKEHTAELDSCLGIWGCQACALLTSAARLGASQWRRSAGFPQRRVLRGWVGIAASLVVCCGC